MADTLPTGLDGFDDIEEYLQAHENKGLLRFITCGSVDDGKSTLIGRLLYESKLILEDQMAALGADSKKVGTQGGDLDFALLVDGLAAEREQGITIDVAYRFFTTNRRKFIVADTPGHEQYTRNMVTGASTADLAIILIDARKGVLTQTRRHGFLVSLLGIRKVVLAVNKLDLVGYSEEVFNQIDTEYREFAKQIGIVDLTCIPISAIKGDNLTTSSPNTPWYEGPSLMDFLETVEIDQGESGPFRFPVQWVNRPNLDFRGYSGMVTGGTIHKGDSVTVMPAGINTTVDRIVTMDGDLDEATVGQSVTVTVTDEVDVSRGDVLVDSAALPNVADQFEAHVVWMGEAEMLPGRQYLMKIGTRTVNATIAKPKFKIDVNTMDHVPAMTLALNEIGICTLTADQQIVFEPYSVERDLGGFILIDKSTFNTVGAGMLNFALRRSGNIQWQTIEVNDQAHAALKGHKPCIVWMTGLSGAGKSTVGNILEKQLHSIGAHTFMLDGDNIRHGISKDLGFTDADRVENIRRVAEISKLMVQAGLIVIVALISPFEADRQMVRDLVQGDHFIEVFIDTPLDVAAGRDSKGLYKKARSGELVNFTGVDSAYEPPTHPDIRVDTSATAPEVAAAGIVAHLRSLGVLPAG